MQLSYVYPPFLQVLVRSDAVTLFATVRTSRLGRFDFNGVTLLPRVPVTFVFTPWETVSDLQGTVHVDAVNAASARALT